MSEGCSSKPYRWVTPRGVHKPDLRELIRLACAGERWEDIGCTFFPTSANAIRKACDTFTRYASILERTERRASLASRGFNRIGKGGPPRKQVAEIVVDDEADDAGLPLRPENRDPWAGMGACFARPTTARG